MRFLSSNLKVGIRSILVNDRNLISLRLSTILFSQAGEFECASLANGIADYS